MGQVHFSSDTFAWKLADCLLEDLAELLEESFRCTVSTHVGSRNIGELRKLKARLTGLTVTQLKAEYQLCNLFKRYIFRHDAMAKADILETSEKKFWDNQDRLPLFRNIEPHRLEWRIRDHCSRILGNYSEVEVMENCAFGRRSSIGIPFSEACEGARYDGPLTGSRDHILWFEHRYGVFNRPAANYVAERTKILGIESTFKECTALEAVLVDKTWNSKRMIVPNTTIGTLYTSGLGKVVQSRLKNAGYDITLLQEEHKRLARSGSLSSDIVTADQSLASDNITSDTVGRFLPMRWADAFRFGRIGKLRFNSREQEVDTFCTMGIGFTFPLQTLLFLSILLAIRDDLSLGEETVISVYGDDLIYDKRMHDSVVQVFSYYGLVINAEKTFAEGYFRESCGSDYYHGFDVRPFFLGTCGGTSEKEILAFLYKTINGLNRRWNCEEIPGTLRYISGCAYEQRGFKPLHHVPHDYPDTAGVRDVSHDSSIYERWERNVHGTYTFSYLGFIPNRRTESRETAYLFLALKRVSIPDDLANLALSKVRPRLGLIYLESIPMLKQERDPWVNSTNRHGRKRFSTRSTVVINDSGYYREQKGKTFARPIL